MKIYLTLGSLLFNCALYATALKPCEVIGYERVVEQGLPLYKTGISPQAREEALVILKKCISEDAVCIIGDTPKTTQWLSTEFIEPQNGNFDPMKTDLVFGMIQYADKETGLSYCIAARYDFSYLSAWNAKKWIIEGKTIQEVELYDDILFRVKTPKSLYHALLTAKESEDN